MKSTTIVFFVLILLTFSSCKKNNSNPAEKEPVEIQFTEKSLEVIQRSNAFGVELFRAVALEDENANLMLSPLSASTALTMLLNGCDGQTYTQIRDMLGFEDLTNEQINEAYQSLVTQLLAADPEVNIALANAVWYRNNFAVYPTYLQNMQAAFDAHIEGLDFALPSALQTMNKWASDNTNGKITQVLTEISPDAVMFLMNALYFKGIWSEQFKVEDTYNAPFTVEIGNVINTPTMHGIIPSKVYFGEEYSALEMYYGRKNFSMIILLPNDGLEEFIDNFTAEVWEEASNGLSFQSNMGDVNVSMPKFSFEYEKYLNDQLMALGMTDAFDKSLADLSKIADDPLFVSFVKQNTFVDVNEEGTEAAAVTTIGIELTSAGNPLAFVVDKPFIFAIREQTTNTLLFLGKVVEP